MIIYQMTAADIEEEKVEELPKKRQTTVNTMIGSVKKGKYSI